MNYKFPTISTANPQSSTRQKRELRLPKTTITGLVTIGLAVLLLAFAGCDSFGSGRYGLSLDIVNEPQRSWRIENITRSRVLFRNLSSNGENVFLAACDRRTDECERKLVAIPTEPPPENCRAWEPQYYEAEVPYDERDHDQWHLDQPEGLDCAGY
jgi:hypothetical protein